jgi:hypothetical protein
MLVRRDFLVLASGLVTLTWGGSTAADGVARIALSRLHRNPELPGVDYDPAVERLVGRAVRAEGFLAPHIGRFAPFMVLTEEPVVGCPHCRGSLDLPGESLIAYFKEPPSDRLIGLPVVVQGILDLGSRSDSRTGFVSTVRLLDAKVVG